MWEQEDSVSTTYKFGNCVNNDICKKSIIYSTITYSSSLRTSPKLLNYITRFMLSNLKFEHSYLVSENKYFLKSK